jgi:hypothetical protein
VCDIGEKIAPSTLRIVNNGKNAIRKTTVKKNIGLPTWSEARRMRNTMFSRVTPPLPRWRWIFSITMKLEQRADSSLPPRQLAIDHIDRKREHALARVLNLALIE